jgi:hypothetical protein
MISKFTSIVKLSIVATTLLVASQTVKAQVVKTEGFDNNIGATTWPNNEMPFGWATGKITPSVDANNAWERVNGPISLNPTPAPATHGGMGQIRFRSFYIVNNNEAGYVVTRPYDLSARGAVTSNLSFWLYRDNTYAYNDVVTVKVNNSNSLTGASASLPEMTTFSFTGIPRNASQAPAAPGSAAGWYQYTFQIPAAGYSTNTLYAFIIVTHTGGAGAGGGNVYIDDFSIDTYPSAQTFNSIGLDYQNAVTVAKPSTNNWIIGCRVTMNNEASQCAMGAFQFAHNGCTNPGTDIANSGTGGVKLWWTGGTNVFSLTNAVLVGQYGGASFPVATFNIIPVVASFAGYGGGLLNGNNYFWLTYDIANGATAGDYVDADFISANLCASLQTCGGVGCTLAGACQIDVAYCIPSYTAGTSWLNGSFTNNDYVKKVICPGDLSYPPGINNDHTDCATGSFPVGAGYPADPCVPSNNFLQGSSVTPFSPHPPDYTKIPIASVPNLCGAGTSSRTAVFLADGTASYTISIQCGTWFGSNCVAAWIDFNHDGVFNNTMVPTPGGEKLCQSGYMNALTWLGPISFAVPNGATTGYFGTTTLRVREWYANPSMDACSPGYYGEVEDYTVTLRPGCSALYPGWKIWLGYTDDWNVNSNWCGGVPTINDNALIPGYGAQAFNRGAGTYHPVIKTGVLATTRKLVILNDTVEANAPTPGSLRVSDTLSIGVASAVNTSALIVDSAYSANAVLSNGVNINTNFIPFRGSFVEQKSQLMYKTAELVAQGMMAGDMIDKIIIPIRARHSTSSYPVTITMYYATNGGAYPTFTTTGYSSPPPAGPNCLAPQATLPQTVFSGPINLTGIPLNGAGNYTVNLTTPFAFTNNPATPLIVEICYSMPGPTGNDDSWQTQTVGYRSYLIMSNLGAYAPPACSWVNINPNGTNVTQRFATDLRPNLTFGFHRVFTKFPIQLETNGATTGHWMNFGTFVPANSIVEFKGTTNAPISPQLISGTNNTTFDELKINNTGTSHVKQIKAATVNDTLWLTNGRLMLNALTLTVMNNSLGGITRASGYLYSEDLPPNYGLINWKMGATLGTHTFPFITFGGAYIPFIYNATAGTSDLTVGTYYPSTTPPSLLPWPTGVTTINSYNNPAVSDAPHMVQRFWIVTNPGAVGTATADLTFTWNNTIAPVETPTAGLAALVSQRWNGAPITWDWSAPGQTQPMVNQVFTPAVTNFNTPWSLTHLSDPLPIKLLTFTAKAEKDKVKLDWATASESNINDYTVERTTDAAEFNFIDRVQSRGPSTGALNYTTYDYHPAIGLQYYRLTQTDFSGAGTYSKLVPVTFGKDTKFEIVTTVSYDDKSFDVIFNYSSELPYSYKIADMLGNVVVQKSDLKAVNGSNIINVKANLASGVYTIIIQNQDETVAKKIFR